MEYNTHQKKLLIDFLRLHSDKAYTIEEIANEIPVSKSTIYRLISKLTKNDVVKRFSEDFGRIFRYQYVSCGHCSAHLHMKCIDCGKILHMDNSVSDILLDSIKDGNDFSVDRSRTILLGKCAHCNKIQPK